MADFFYKFLQKCTINKDHNYLHYLQTKNECIIEYLAFVTKIKCMSKYINFENVKILNSIQHNQILALIILIHQIKNPI